MRSQLKPLTFSLDKRNVKNLKRDQEVAENLSRCSDNRRDVIIKTAMLVNLS